jgi:hypothetical protein
MPWRNAHAEHPHRHLRARVRGEAVPRRRARGRATHLRAFFGDAKPAAAITVSDIREYQIVRRQQGAAAGTVKRRRSTACCTLRCNSAGFQRFRCFQRAYARIRQDRASLSITNIWRCGDTCLGPFRMCSIAYYSGWRRREILELTWNEVDLAGGVIRPPQTVRKLVSAGYCRFRRLWRSS